MDKKLLFNEALTSLVDFAAANANHVTMDDVKLYFKDLIDDDSQYQFITTILPLIKLRLRDLLHQPIILWLMTLLKLRPMKLFLKLLLFLTMLNQKKNYLLLRCIWKKWKPPTVCILF